MVAAGLMALLTTPSDYPKKNPWAFSFAILFSLFLVGVLFFSKRALEPSLSLYTDLSLPSSPPLSQPPFGFLLPQNKSSHAQTPPPQALGPVATSQLPISLIPELGISGSDAAIEENGSKEKLRRDAECDLYNGSWVKDEEESYPLYEPGSCPYIDDAYTCQENGRSDGDYMKWRWKPHGCDLPRFNATDFLERLRGKRLMLVGDSMNRNQFESMLCLLREALPDKSKMYETRGYKITKGRGYFIFQFTDFNCTVEFCRSHFLVREGTRLNPQGNSRPTLMIDRIDKSATRWKHADILIFNTGHWWNHGKTSRGKNYFQEGDVIYPKLDAVEAYKRALKTWGRWIDNNMSHRKNLVFYRGYSTPHFRGGDWDSGGTCNRETQPILNGSFLNNYPWKMRITEEVILREMQFPVVLLNVTRLTNSRKDGHPSIYRKNVTQGKKVSIRKQDCSHWCLPGVPDAWNELIYASLVMEQVPTRTLLEDGLN